MMGENGESVKKKFARPFLFLSARLCHVIIIKEKVRLYMEQTNDRADTLPLDNAEELPFD